MWIKWRLHCACWITGSDFELHTLDCNSSDCGLWLLDCDGQISILNALYSTSSATHSWKKVGTEEPDSHQFWDIILKNTKTLEKYSHVWHFLEKLRWGLLVLKNLPKNGTSRNFFRENRKKCSGKFWNILSFFFQLCGTIVRGSGGRQNGWLSGA